jgi:hypothetical protein
MVADDKSAPKAHEHPMSDVTGLLAELAAKAASDHLHAGVYAVIGHLHDWNEIFGKPEFFSGAYADLTGKPVLFSGAYADLIGLPNLGDAASKNVGTTAGTVAAGDHIHPG